MSETITPSSRLLLLDNDPNKFKVSPETAETSASSLKIIARSVDSLRSYVENGMPHTLEANKMAAAAGEGIMQRADIARDYIGYFDRLLQLLDNNLAKLDQVTSLQIEQCLKVLQNLENYLLNEYHSWLASTESDISLPGEHNQLLATGLENLESPSPTPTSESDSFSHKIEEIEYIKNRVSYILEFVNKSKTKNGLIDYQLAELHTEGLNHFNIIVTFLEATIRNQINFRGQITNLRMSVGGAKERGRDFGNRVIADYINISALINNILQHESAISVLQNARLDPAIGNSSQSYTNTISGPLSHEVPPEALQQFAADCFPIGSRNVQAIQEAMSSTPNFYNEFENTLSELIRFSEERLRELRDLTADFNVRKQEIFAGIIRLGQESPRIVNRFNETAMTLARLSVGQVSEKDLVE